MGVYNGPLIASGLRPVAGQARVPCRDQSACLLGGSSLQDFLDVLGGFRERALARLSGAAPLAALRGPPRSQSRLAVDLSCGMWTTKASGSARNMKPA